MLPVAEILEKLRELSPNGVPSYRWASLHPAKVQAWVRRWQIAHPEKVREYRKARDNRRRARENNAIGSFTASQWRDLVEIYYHRCAYCDKKTLKLTVDHILPLSKGGTNNIGNIVPACSKCNYGKRDRLWDVQPSLEVR